MSPLSQDAHGTSTVRASAVTWHRGTFLLEKGCEGKDAQDCFILGQLAASRMRMGALRRAEDCFEKACGLGSADACRKVGRPAGGGKR
jgi:hypothetical protein